MQIFGLNHCCCNHWITHEIRLKSDGSLVQRFDHNRGGSFSGAQLFSVSSFGSQWAVGGEPGTHFHWNARNYDAAGGSKNWRFNYNRPGPTSSGRVFVLCDDSGNTMVARDPQSHDSGLGSTIVDNPVTHKLLDASGAVVKEISCTDGGWPFQAPGMGEMFGTGDGFWLMGQFGLTGDIFLRHYDASGVVTENREVGGGSIIFPPQFIVDDPYLYRCGQRASPGSVNRAEFVAGSYTSDWADALDDIQCMALGADGFVYAGRATVADLTPCESTSWTPTRASKW